MSDIDEITRVIHDYARGVDRQDWELVRSCYHPDAYDDHGAYKGDVDGLIADMQARHPGIATSVHALTNVLVDVVSPTVAYGETYCLAHQRFERDGTWFEVDVRCRYADRFERRDRWRISRRIVAYDTVSVREAAPPTPIDPRWTAGSRSHDDVTYRREEPS